MLPCLEFHIEFRCRFAGGYVYVPIAVSLYSDDGKLLSTNSDINYSYSGGAYAGSLVVAWDEHEPIDYVIVLHTQVLLSPKALEYIEQRRRANEYREARLQLRIRFLEIHGLHSNSLQPINIFGTSAYALKDGKVLFSALQHLESVDFRIDAIRWSKEFLPSLGLGSYLIIEMPALNTRELPVKVLERLDKALKALETARTKLHIDLDPASALTALRNAIVEFCFALKPLGLSQSKGPSCFFIHDKLAELLGRKELADIVDEVYKTLKNLTSVGSEATQPHMAASPTPEPYQVESLIILVTSLFKLVLDTIRVRSK